MKQVPSLYLTLLSPPTLLLLKIKYSQILSSLPRTLLVILPNLIRLLFSAPWSTSNFSSYGFWFWLLTICWSSGINFKDVKNFLNLSKFLRFEYLWPFWLLVRSIYDSFKYQGLVRDTPCWQSQFSFHLLAGFFSFLHLHSPDQRHDLFPLHTCPLALLRCQHLRLGAVRLAHGEGDLPPNSIPLAALRLH